MSGFEGMDIWKLATILQNRMSGYASALPPNRDIEAQSVQEVEDRRERARSEFAARGFTDDQIDVVRARGPAAHLTITESLAAGGSRYGATPSPD